MRIAWKKFQKQKPNWRTIWSLFCFCVAEEQVSECPAGCHGRGDCEDGQCECFPGYDGWDCAQSKSMNETVSLVLLLFCQCNATVLLSLTAFVATVTNGRWMTSEMWIWTFELKKKTLQRLREAALLLIFGAWQMKERESCNEHWEIESCHDRGTDK